MQRTLFVVAFLLVAGSAHAESYTLIGDAWTCKGPGALANLDADRATDGEINTAQCLPAFSDLTVNVVAFQGAYAFECETIKGSMMGDITDCSYVLTKNLRDKKGAVVPDHVSKGSTPLRTPPPRHH